MVVAVQVINLSPTQVLNGDVPEQVWTGKEVAYKYFRVFGCRAFAHVPKDERSKLDNKSRECIFLSHGDEKFGYKLYDPMQKKIVRSRDVKFIEDQNITSVKYKAVAQDHNDDLVDWNLDDELNEWPRIIIQENVDTDLPGNQQENEIVTQINNDIQLPANNEMKDLIFKMEEEMTSLHKNTTYSLVKRVPCKKVLKNKWVYKLKFEKGKTEPRYKARLVVKGFEQKYGVDYDEIFSPVVKMTSIRVILGVVASLNLELQQLDLKTFFLHGDLEEFIHMEQPEGFVMKGKEGLICRLNKSLYGLKQDPRRWYKKFHTFMIDQGFKKTLVDHCVYCKRFNNQSFIILLFYVDDMLLVVDDVKKINTLKSDLSRAFEMKDLGKAKHSWGCKLKETELEDTYGCHMKNTS
ncbi:transmembrane signal receptor [Lithospermum erythrorhizon]|uniref:Transmembrane signal receptor n=1 Tax=Lithospermum erythrorhizon TaxID=34254 RepID=A0AAV3RQV9_LITER